MFWDVVMGGFLVRLGRVGNFSLSPIKAACGMSLPAVAIYKLLLEKGVVFHFHSLILFLVQFLKMRSLASSPAQI